jgi:hypothetical protein
MAFSYRILETKTDGANKSSYDSDDVSGWTLTPAANTVWVVTAAAAETSATEPPTPWIAGFGLTWYEIDADIFFNDRLKGSVWWTSIGGTPPSSGVYTVGYYGNNQERWTSTVIEITGADAAEFVRKVSGTPNEAAATGTGTSPSATTPNAPTGSNAIMGVCFWDASSSETFSAGTDFTQQGVSRGFTSSEPAEASEWDTTPADGTADATLSGSTDWGMLAFEVKAEVSERKARVYAYELEVPTAVAPAPPSNVQAGVFPTAIDGSFTAGDATVQHRAYIREVGETKWRTPADLAIGETAYRFEYLEAGKSYEIGFTAFRGWLESPMATVPPPPPVTADRTRYDGYDAADRMAVIDLGV